MLPVCLCRAQTCGFLICAGGNPAALLKLFSYWLTWTSAAGDCLISSAVGFWQADVDDDRQNKL